MKKAIGLILVFVGFLSFVPNGYGQDITTNILQRVFLFKYGDKVGTSFTIDVQNRQYIITAKHIVDGIKNGESIEILHNNHWEKIVVKPLYIKPDIVDMIVLVPEMQVTPAHPIEPTTGGLILAQQIYFLGFPYSLHMDGNTLNNGLPLPFVKSGILSAMVSPTKEYQIIYIDGINNPGFSGGPIVFVDHQTRKLKVAGVVKGYKNTDDQENNVYRKIPKENGLSEDDYELVKTDMIAKTNSGLVIGFSIQSAVDAINKNPIGPVVKGN